MKRLKFLLAFVFLLVGVLSVVAFTNAKYRKSAMANVCFRYTGVQPASEVSIENSSNWTSIFPNPLQYCPGGYDLCAICFNDSTMTPYEAREVLRNYLHVYGYLPMHGQSIIGPGGKVITVYLKEEIE